jgi:hypothetical protein
MRLLWHRKLHDGIAKLGEDCYRKLACAFHFVDVFILYGRRVAQTESELVHKAQIMSLSPVFLWRRWPVPEANDGFGLRP